MPFWHAGCTSFWVEATMIPKKQKKEKKQPEPGPHRTTKPRRLTAEGWWRKQAKQKGRVIRPKETHPEM
jgi:hypothetical protein